jgi:sugar lactone lactonase YvrE
MEMKATDQSGGLAPTVTGPIRRLADRFGFAESPRWHDGRLWVSDLALRRVSAIAEDGSVETVCELNDRPSGLGWLPDGTLLVVSMYDRVLLRLTSSGLEPHIDLSGIPDITVLNDMVVARDGRAYIGNPGTTQVGTPGSGSDTATYPTGIIVVSPDGTSGEMQYRGLSGPNGSAITPDGREFLVAETRLGRVSVLDLAADGQLGERSTFGTLSAGSWADGICLDAEGAVWVADPINHRCVRMLRGGEVTDVIDTSPVPTVACMLGGPDGCTLYLVVQPFQSHERNAEARQGRIEMIRVKVPGAGLP